MWSLSYIISQIFVVFAIGVLATTYLIKDRSKIYVLSVFYSLCYAVSYFFLSAWAGVFLNIASILRNIWFLVEYKTKGKTSIASLFCSMILLTVSSVLVFVFNSFHPIELLILSETLIYTFSLWQKNNTFFRWLALYSSFCWLTYNIYVYSLFAIVLESALLVAKFTGICLLYIKKGKSNKKI